MPVEEPIRIEKPILLGVEGYEDKFFFEALIYHLKLENIQVIPVGGKEKFRPTLKALTISAGFASVSSLGIVRDANSNPNNTFLSICEALQAVHLPTPIGPLTTAEGSPRVTIMIVPEENTAGMLEDLCLRSVVSEASTVCVEQYFQCLKRQDVPLPKNISKAKVQVFLASRAIAGKRLGEAAKAGYWPWDNEAFEQINTFLRQISS